MNIPLNSGRYFQRIGRIPQLTELLFCKSRPFSVFVLLKENKNTLIKQASQIRFLFTEDFLGISVFRHKQLLADKEVSELQLNPADFRKSITERIPQKKASSLKLEGDIPAETDTNITIAEAQIADKELLSDDVRKLILMTKSKEQMITTQHVLKHFVATSEPYDNAAILAIKGQLFKDYMHLCRIHKWIEPAQGVWNDEEFIDRVGFIDVITKRMATKMPTITLCYLDILYEKKMYQDVVDEVQRLETSTQVPEFAYVLGMMACLRINTNSSLSAATCFYNGKSGGHIMKISRVVHPYALLLCHQDNPRLALETVSLLSSRHFPALRAGIKVYFLSKLNRPEEACALLESVLRNSAREDTALASSRGQGVPKLIFSIESVKALTEVVESRKDVSLNARLAGIFSRLDKVASITEKNMVELVTADIDADRSIKNKRLKEAQWWEKNGPGMKESISTAEIEDNELLDDRHHR